jgi:hypothetical protein
VHEAGPVRRERRRVVGATPFRPAVAAQIGGDGPEAGAGQRRKLMAPRSRELGKPVQEQDERPVGRPGSEGVEADAVRVEVELVHACSLSDS